MAELLHAVRVVIGAVLIHTTDLVVNVLERLHERRGDER